ncbi:hypothetical protein A2U01_0022598, partial [Trifolium medium]|nr:hypothetical protein [Trifolium medium]MCI01571.1 hypothetical protein [Trifolium medium]
MNKYGKKFGFVRFKMNTEVRLLEKELNNVWIDLYKLRVNISRFSREEEDDNKRQGRRPATLNKNQRQKHEFDVRSSRQGRREQEDRAAEQQRERRQVDKIFSYAQVTAKQNKQRVQSQKNKIAETKVEEEWKGLTYKAKLDEEEWLKNAYVGTVHKPEDVIGLQEKLKEAGIYSISTRYMGGKKVFIGINENESMEELVKEEETTLRKWFNKI